MIYLFSKNSILNTHGPDHSMTALLNILLITLLILERECPGAMNSGLLWFDIIHFHKLVFFVYGQTIPVNNLTTNRKTVQGCSFLFMIRLNGQDLPDTNLLKSHNKSQVGCSLCPGRLSAVSRNFQKNRIAPMSAGGQDKVRTVK